MAEFTDESRPLGESQPQGTLEAAGARWHAATEFDGSRRARSGAHVTTLPDERAPPIARSMSQREVWMVVYVPVLILLALAYFVFSGR